MTRWLTAWLCGGGLLACLAATAQAQSHCQTPTTTPEDFTRSNYGIELFNGPVIGASRPVGMAGAYTAVADGIDGAQFNPAAYGERPEHELDFWELELTGDVYLGGFFTNNDVNNDGCSGSSARDALRLFGGGRMLFGPFGIGGSLQLEGFSLRNDSAPEGSQNVDVTIGTWSVGWAYAFYRQQLVVGMGLRGVVFDMDAPAFGEQPAETLASLNGAGFEFGVLYRPNGKRYRIGAAFSTGVLALGDEVTNEQRALVQERRGIWIPSSVEMPFELKLGFAYQFGERRANPVWPGDARRMRAVRDNVKNGKYEPPPRYGGPPYPKLPEGNERAAVRQAFRNELEAERRFIDRQPRRYTLLSADLIVYGAASENVHGVDAFLAQREQRSGEMPDIGLRIGTESEVVPMLLKLRGGFYVEPSRFRESRYRPHITAGVDIRLFRLWLFDIRARGTVDLALRFNEGRYIDWGASLGVWH